MSKQIYINLPVKNLVKATSFYEAIGFEKNLMFSNENATGLNWSDNIILMLLKESFYQQFVPEKKIADAHTVSAAILCISMDSKEEVEEFAEKAKAAGGKVYSVEMNKQDDWMYGLSVEDLDGHVWEPLWSDISKFPASE